MSSRKRQIKLFGLMLFSISVVWSTQVQLITSHKKSNGTLLRIVTSSVLDINRIQLVDNNKRCLQMARDPHSPVGGRNGFQGVHILRRPWV